MNKERGQKLETMDHTQNWSTYLVNFSSAADTIANDVSVAESVRNAVPISGQDDPTIQIEDQMQAGRAKARIC